jgi:hypothetical protein
MAFCAVESSRPRDDETFPIASGERDCIIVETRFVDIVSLFVAQTTIPARSREEAALLVERLIATRIGNHH